MYNEPAGCGPVVGRAEALERYPDLDGEVWQAADASFAVRVTRSFVAQVEHADDVLGRQVFPHPGELLADPGDVDDPVGERFVRPVPWVVHKHPDRVLLLVTRRCHLHCRFCFRRDQDSARDPSPRELEAALAYARGCGAEEAILSGGDPLALKDGQLFAIVDALRPQVPVVRIHTRAPITAPERVTHELVAGLAARRPTWVVVHTNHARELSASVRAALSRLRDAGLGVLSQSVLLAGVNDDADTLAELFQQLVRLGVVPHYLHHPDPVPGTAHFRVDPARGLALFRAVSQRISGVALPRYVLDRPDGSGKIDVAGLLPR